MIHRLALACATAALLLLCSGAASAQHAVYLKPPSNVSYEAEYDPHTNRYMVYEKVGGRRVGLPRQMSSEEYGSFRMEQSMRDYWRQKQAGETDGGQGDGLLPKINLGGEGFDRIFGSNTIEIVPQGNVDLNFGVTHSRTANAALPVEQQRNTAFDFKAEFQVNVTGKIGDKVGINLNLDTKGTFDFERNVKLDYTGYEDEIVQKIEAGNVSLPLPGTLITGGQSLFGLKTQLKFGRLDVTLVASQQESEMQTMEIQGGAQVREFEVTADSYDANRHFFLAHYFRDNYDRHLSSLPLIVSGVNITKLEVWVTNKQSDLSNARNILALIDLGEGSAHLHNPGQVSAGGHAAAPPHNDINSLYSDLQGPLAGIRDVSQVNSTLSGLLSGGYDYEKVESARRLSSTEYSFNPQLGFLSLHAALNSDEVLAVAYEYTLNGQTYKVGELSTDGINSPQTLVVKLLKGTNHTPSLPTWDLMMKNVYSLNAYQISPKDFRLEVLYQDDATGSSINYLPEGRIANKPLIGVLNLDNMDAQRDAGADGVFDFVEGITILPGSGKIIFPVLEPFGRHLAAKIGDPEVAERYVFQELYDQTLTNARQMANKNKFIIQGSYASEGGSEIFLMATNIPKGSVVVTAGGVQLVEDVQYLVDYNLGSVRIIDEGLLESGQKIRVSVESNSTFKMQTKRLLGTHMNYNISDNFNIGATAMHLWELPLTQKVNYGSEAIANTIWGLNTSYRTEMPLLTKAIDALPFIQTKEKSSIAFDAEFAQLLPGTTSVTEGSVYIDDFEGSSSSIDIHSWVDWRLASTPQLQPDMFPEGNRTNDLSYGHNRALLAWYTVDPLFSSANSNTPSYIRSNKDLQSDHFSRVVYERELFPNRQNVPGSETRLSVLNLAFYPRERGPYNYDTKLDADGFLTSPQTRWGGIMRNLTTTDFETSNIEYIEFWMMDPFVNNPSASGGDLYFHLGNISEDILRDGRKSFENGMPTAADMQGVDTTVWGRVPAGQYLNVGFDNDPAMRTFQDIGLDGLSSKDLDGDGIPDERSFFAPYLNSIQATVTNATALARIEDDPSNDDFVHYLDERLDNAQSSILDRYKRYNNPEGNSSVATGATSRQSYSTPDVEELGTDNTMNENEAYYQYRISLRPQDMVVGKNFITNKITTSEELPNGQHHNVNWYQFKVPIGEYSDVFGAMDDFTSIRFMRIVMRGFEDTAVVRLATLHLVRGDWRRYKDNLIEGREGLPQTDMPSTTFDIAAVNIEENDQRSPVNYVLPPGVKRETDASTNLSVEINEQSMEYKVMNLTDGDARAAYKTMNLDMRHYRTLRMFAHAEQVEGHPLADGEVTAFIRMGSDYTDNYYEYEIPLKLTPHRINYTSGEADRLEVWPEENTFNINLDDLTQLKQQRNQAMRQMGSSVSHSTVYTAHRGAHRIKVTGNPNLGQVKVIMLGIRNPSRGANPADDGLDKSVIVWFNELRLSNFEDKSGWAANASLTSRLADLGTLTLSGSAITAGFGALDAKVNERSLDNIYQYNVSSALDMGRFFPRKLNVRLPLFFAYGESFSSPEYNPFDPDIVLRESLKGLSRAERDSVRRLVQEYTRTKSLNFTNVKIDQPTKKPHFWNISNFAITYSFSDHYTSNYKTIHRIQQNERAALTYNYNRTSKHITPFKRIKYNALALIRDFNFSLLPSALTFQTDMSRSYYEQQLRNVENPSFLLMPTYSKDFLWNRHYGMRWDLSKSLKFEFKADNTARIDEPDGMVDRRRDKRTYEIWRDSVLTNIKNFGRNTMYNHSFNLSYTIPINKLPLLEWVNSNASYNATYRWQAGAVLADTAKFDYGNTLQNSNQITIGATLNFTALYNKSKYLKDLNSRFDRMAQGTAPKMKTVTHEENNVRLRPRVAKAIDHNLKADNVKVRVTDERGREVRGLKIDIKNNRRLTIRSEQELNNCKVVVEGKVPDRMSPLRFIAEGSLRMLMGIKNVAVNYGQSNGTLLPGYHPRTKLMGLEQYNGQLAPGWPFVLGWQNPDIVLDAQRNGWLTTDTTFSTPVVFNNTTTLNAHANIEPLPGLTIRLQAQRSSSNNRSEHYTFNGIDAYNRYNPQATGNFSISTITLRSFFGQKAEGNSTKAFNNMRAMREQIAKRLNDVRVSNASVGYKHLPSDSLAQGQFPNGYSELQQDVLRAAFLAAYTGRNANNALLEEFPSIPLPNWQITYNGLAKLRPLRNLFRSITLSHAYRSTYSIGSYSTNTAYEPLADGFSYTTNLNGDFIPKHDMANAAIAESFSPLIGIEVGMQNSFTANLQMNTERLLSMSFANNQLTETSTQEYIIGFGYRFEDLPLIFKAEDGGKKQIKSDLRLTLDFSIRDNRIVLRKLTENSNDITSGQLASSIKFSADYKISQQVTITMYFNRMLNNPHVSTTFRTSNTSAGFSVNFELMK